MYQKRKTERNPRQERLCRSIITRLHPCCTLRRRRTLVCFLVLCPLLLQWILSEQSRLQGIRQNDDVLIRATSSRTNQTKGDERIPKMLHFVYVSRNLPSRQTIPDSIKSNIQEWKNLHPSWNVMLWNNQRIIDEFPDQMSLLKQLFPLAWISDIVRFLVLERYGGVYIDTDILPLRPIDPIQEYFDVFTVCESPVDQDFLSDNTPVANYVTHLCKTRCTAVIGARPHHPALQHVARAVVSDTWNELEVKLHIFFGWFWSYSPVITGPGKWTKYARAYRVPVLYQTTFYPCHWRERDQCHAENFANKTHVYAMHMWSGSWL